MCYLAASAIIVIIIFVTLLVAHVARLLFSALSVLSCFCLYCCYIIYCMLPLEVNKVVQSNGGSEVYINLHIDVRLYGDFIRLKEETLFYPDELWV